MDIEKLIDKAATASQCDFDIVTREAIILNIVNPLLAASQEPVAYLGEGAGFKSFTRSRATAEKWGESIKVTAVYAAPVSPVVGEDAVEHMVQRFLQWKLPEDFNPDGGVQFVKTTDYGHTFAPVGTNLIGYQQAKAMVLHMLEGLPDAALASSVAKPCGVTDEMVFDACVAFGDYINTGKADTGFKDEQNLTEPMRAALTKVLSHPAQGWREIPVTDENVSYVMQYGGRCRECADAMGVCPTSGLPCIVDEARAAIRHTLRAINYGMAHGYLPSAPAGGSGT